MYSRNCFRFKVMVFFLILSFLNLNLGPAFAAPSSKVQVSKDFVKTSSAFNPPLLKGIKFYPEDPLRFDFIIDAGQVDLSERELKMESSRFIRYFLTALTIPEEELWVNLAPHQEDKIITPKLGKTEMGVDLLGVDYLLKQLMASLTHPETPLGKKVWDKIYARAQELYGTKDIPINTFNKVWIVPDKAIVYESKNKVYVRATHLKVMLEQDYKALKDNGLSLSGDSEDTNQFASQVIKEVVVPVIEKEVNQGKNFLLLRQAYNALILASWFKQKVKNNILENAYLNKGKIKGVENTDLAAKDKIFRQYVKAYEKGVYNYVKKEFDYQKKEYIPRKYYSGGLDLTTLPTLMQTQTISPTITPISTQMAATPTITTPTFSELSMNIPQLPDMTALPSLTQRTLETASSQIRQDLADDIALRTIEMASVDQLASVIDSTPQISMPAGMDSRQFASQLKTELNQMQQIQPIESFDQFAQQTQMATLQAPEFRQTFASSALQTLPQQQRIQIADMSMGRTMPQMSQQDLAPLVGEQAAVDINQQMSQINQEGLATQELAEGPDMTGGIDFNPENFEVQVKGEGLSVTYLDKTFDIDNIEGFTFKILNVSRI